nr:putative ribonuclease H-like domain-containing protein [Tanacetum cinerariifolium]
MWRLRIEQYFQIQDYALWDVIENGPVTIEEKAKKKNDVKARIWSNKSDLDIMSLDDLYNNFKIVEQEVRGTTSTNTSSQNMAFVSSPSPNSTNEVSIVFRVSTANLEQIHKDNLEEIDLKWQLALLSMRAKRDIKIKDSEIVVQKTQLEKISNEKDVLETKIKKFENASQSLDKLIGSQVSNNSKKGLGYVSYNVVPPPHIERFSPPGIDLSYTGLPEFAEPSVQSYGFKHIDVDKVEVAIPKQNDKPARRPVKYAKMYRTQRPRATKDKTSRIFKSFITEIENLVDKKVKIIRCDNRTEFKNRVMNEFYKEKGIKREYSVARTPQQNEVAKRRNRTLIEAARTILADFKLPITFWAEAVNTACYV